MRKDYVVVGKFNKFELDDFLTNETISGFKKQIENLKSNKPLKIVAIIGIGVLVSTLLQDVTTAHATSKHAFEVKGNILSVMAQPNGANYSEPVQLHSILKFIDWLIFMVRWVISSIIGLIASFAGYKWATDISGNGVADAKKILKNCLVGTFWVQFGATIANFFVNKIQSFV